MCFLFSMLITPTVHPSKIPNILIYTVDKPLNSGVIRHYSKLIDLKKGELLAYMNAEKELIPKEHKLVPSLYVDILMSLSKGKGFGTKLMNYAKILSKKLGCEGNIHLIACNSFDLNRVPHIFYKKWGMNTGDYLIDTKMDKFIQKNKKAKASDFPNIEMYYPPVKTEINPDELPYIEEDGFWKSLFKKIFSLK